jgi:hypothetical protein
MAKPKSSARKQALKGTPAALGAGIHAATVELKEGASYHLKLLDGRRTMAILARGVAPKLLDDCLHSRRVVLLADGETGPMILGALQTAEVPRIHQETGVFEVEATHIRLRADASIVLRVGSASLGLERSGIGRIEGDQMVIDVATLLRVLATKVALP